MSGPFIKFIGITLSILFFMILVFPQSFATMKLIFLVVLVVGVLIVISLPGKFKIDITTLLYYLGFSIIIITWSLLSIIKGNSMVAIIDHLRLYIIFMWIYALIVVFISNINYEKYFLILMSSAAISIALVNFYITIDVFLELNSLSTSIKKEMLLEVGIHEGYIQLNSLNIGMLSFITPFLISIWISDSVHRNTVISVATFISILVILLSSRRTIIFIVLLTPFLTYIVSKLTQEISLLKPVLRLYLIFLALTVIFLVIIYFNYPLIYEGFVERILEVFTSDGQEIRRVQNEFLLEGFLNNSSLGSGFGGLVDFVRNSERPWLFELTYSQMLFNFGLIGMAFWIMLFSTFTFVAIMKLRVFSGEKSIYNAMLIGLTSTVLVTSTNPYLGSSFDFIFMLSIIPLIISSINIKKSLFSTGVK